MGGGGGGVGIETGLKTGLALIDALELELKAAVVVLLQVGIPRDMT
jgi:hypothetical protein